MLSAILFDLGGTLIEENFDVLNTGLKMYEIQVKALHSSLEKDGILIDWNIFKDKYEQLRTIQKASSMQALKEYDMCSRVSDALSLFDYDVPSTSNIISRAIDAYMELYINSLRLKEYTNSLLETMFTKYKLGLVTNFAYYPTIHKILDKFDLKRFFNAIVISGIVGWKKPSLQIFEVALSQLSARPEETVFIGDDYEVDIVGAKNAGMKTILLNKETTDNEKADIKIKHLNELPSVIKSL